MKREIFFAITTCLSCVVSDVSAQEIDTAPSSGASDAESDATSSAPEPATSGHDFDRGRQYVWSTLAGATSTLVLGGATLAIAENVCRDGSYGCWTQAGWGLAASLSVGMFASTIVAVNLTGGPRANEATHVATIAGIALGFVTSSLLFSFLPPLARGDDPVTPTSIAGWAGWALFAGASAGAGASLGYQLLYPASNEAVVIPASNEAVVITPWFGDDTTGFALGGRF